VTQSRWHLKETSLSGPQLGGQTDGFLCCQYCLRLLRQDPSRQHGHTTYAVSLPSVKSSDLTANGNEAREPLSVKERKERHSNYARGSNISFKLFHYAFGSASLWSARIKFKRAGRSSNLVRYISNSPFRAYYMSTRPDFCK